MSDKHKASPFPDKETVAHDLQCVHLMEAAMLSAQLIEAEEQRDRRNGKKSRRP